MQCRVERTTPCVRPMHLFTDGKRHKNGEEFLGKLPECSDCLWECILTRTGKVFQFSDLNPSYAWLEGILIKIWPSSFVAFSVLFEPFEKMSCKMHLETQVIDIVHQLDFNLQLRVAISNSSVRTLMCMGKRMVHALFLNRASNCSF